MTRPAPCHLTQWVFITGIWWLRTCDLHGQLHQLLKQVSALFKQEGELHTLLPFLRLDGGW